MKAKRKIIEINDSLCDGCGNCVLSCAEGAIAVIDGKAKVISEKYCDGLGACIGECPQGALHIIEREAEEFDDEAVAEHLKNKQKPEAEMLPCGCPSARMESFEPEPEKETGVAAASQRSALTHWPVQIRLIPPDAPFLKNADLLVASDCTAFSCPNFHSDFIAGRAVLVGCPKFDNQEMYRDKFAEIFRRSDIKHITVVVMEVPCCHGLPLIVKEGMEIAGKKVPLEIVTLSIRGEIIKRVQDAA